MNVTSSDLSTRRARRSATVVPFHTRTAAHGFAGREREPAGEHRCPLEHEALRFGQQRVAPVDDRPQRLLARRCGARTSGEQAEPVVEAGQQVARRERPHPGRGQLDRQWEPVQLRADGLQLREVVLRLELGRDRMGVRHEQVDRVVERQRGQRPQRLTGDGERLTTRREHVELAAVRDQIGNDVCDLGDDVLAVVEHEEQLAPGEVLAQAIERSGGGARAVLRLDAEGGRDRRGDVCHVADRRQVRQPDAVGMPVQPAACDLDRESRSPTPPGPTTVTTRCRSSSALVAPTSV